MVCWNLSIEYTIDLRRAYNCEIVLSKVKIPLPDMLNAVLALGSSALDIDQVENLIKFCPTKEEMEMLKNYSGNKEMLGKCEQVLSFEGSAVGFKLDSLLKLSDTRARNNKMTLMHYLCKLLSEKMPELLDFGKDLVHLEAASKIQLKALAEEMQAVSKGLEKVEQELTASENDGVISAGFHKGRNADSLSRYFGEDPARCPFEQVTQILVVFVKMFNKSREESERQADAEKKKLEKEAMKELRTPVNTNLKKDVH